MKTRLTTIVLIAMFLLSVATIAIPVNAKAHVIQVPDDYTTIQDAIDAAVSGDTIIVKAGLYIEQLDISVNVEIKGSGNGKTIIQSPDLLTKSFVTSTNLNKPIIYVHDTDDVKIKDLTVDGAGKGNLNYRFIGVAFFNAGGKVELTTIMGIRDTPMTGMQHGVAIYAYVNNGIPRTLEIAHNDISDYQKNGMALIGTGLIVKVDHNTVTGSGPLGLGLPAQNGIQVSSGATGEVSHNEISDNWYTPATWAATGILIQGSNDCKIEHNKIDACLVGIYNIGSNNELEHNKITNCEWDIA